MNDANNLRCRTPSRGSKPYAVQSRDDGTRGEYVRTLEPTSAIPPTLECRRQHLALKRLGLPLFAPLINAARTASISAPRVEQLQPIDFGERATRTLDLGSKDFPVVSDCVTLIGLC